MHQINLCPVVFLIFTHWIVIYFQQPGPDLYHFCKTECAVTVVSSFSGLSSVHTIFVRHHNRIARFFRKKTRWGPERIYQETRRIIAAQLQVITYKEFLPLVLSKKTVGFHMQNFCFSGRLQIIMSSKTDPKRIKNYKITRKALILNCKAFQNDVLSVIRGRPYNVTLRGKT